MKILVFFLCPNVERVILLINPKNTSNRRRMAPAWRHCDLWNWRFSGSDDEQVAVVGTLTKMDQILDAYGYKWRRGGSSMRMVSQWPCLFVALRRYIQGFLVKSTKSSVRPAVTSLQKHRHNRHKNVLPFELVVLLKKVFPIKVKRNTVPFWIGWIYLKILSLGCSRPKKLSHVILCVLE